MKRTLSFIFLLLVFSSTCFGNSKHKLPPMFFMHLSGPSGSWINKTTTYSVSWTDGYGNSVAAPSSTDYHWSVSGGVVVNSGSYYCTVKWTSAGTGRQVKLDFNYFGMTYSDYVNVAVYNSPTTQNASAISTSAFTANWSSSDANSYLLYVAKDVNFTNMVSGYNGKSVSGSSYQVSGLGGGQVYYYRVKGVNASGTSSYSNTMSLVTIPNAPTLYVPSTSYISQSSIKADWNNVTGATAYKLDVSLSSSFSQYSYVSGYQNLTVSNSYTFIMAKRSRMP